MQGPIRGQGQGLGFRPPWHHCFLLDWLLGESRRSGRSPTSANVCVQGHNQVLHKLAAQLMKEGRTVCQLSSRCISQVSIVMLYQSLPAGLPVPFSRASRAFQQGFQGLSAGFSRAVQQGFLGPFSRASRDFALGYKLRQKPGLQYSAVQSLRHSPWTRVSALTKQKPSTWYSSAQWCRESMTSWRTTAWPQLSTPLWR